MANFELPQSVFDLAELAPVEDVLLAILREHLPEVNVTSTIPAAEDTDLFPLILARGASSSFGAVTREPRFIGRSAVTIHTFTQDPPTPGLPGGDQQGAILSEAVRVIFRDVGLAKPFIPGIGTILAITMTSPPRRVSDWATATGPVQYADLPAGVWRYETHYRLSYRRPLK